jgi:hypothetical protein
MKRLAFAVVCAVLFAGKPVRAQEAVDVSTYTFTHNYKAGEKFAYLFEESDYSYSADLKDGFRTAGNLEEIMEFHFKVNIEIVDVNGELKKKFTISGVTYRGLKNTKDGLEKNPLEPATKVAPGFPEEFSYTCKLNESDFVQAILKTDKPYMTGELGVLIYQKLTDVHTFGVSIGGLKTEIPETFQVKASTDVTIKTGVFHNNSPVSLFEGIETVNGERLGYFKVMTMGNTYKLPDRLNLTDYQYAFHIGMDGPYKGMLIDGNLQEHGFDSRDMGIISRQLSMRRVE